MGASSSLNKSYSAPVPDSTGEYLTGEGDARAPGGPVRRDAAWVDGLLVPGETGEVRY